MELLEAYGILGLEEGATVSEAEAACFDKCCTISIEPYEPPTPEEVALYRGALAVIKASLM